MESRPWGSLTAQILAALEECGPMSRIELCQHLGMSRQMLAALCNRLVRETPKRPQRVHIAYYVDEAEGSRRYPRAVYALGPGANAAKPRPNVAENKRRYNQRVRMRNVANSVFNLARPRRLFQI